MEVIQQKTNNKLIGFAVLEFFIVFAAIIFTWLNMNLESLTPQGSIVWYEVLPMIISIAIAVKGVLLNRAEKKLTGKRNLTLGFVNVISILFILFIIFIRAANIILLVLLFSSFGGQ